MRGHSGIIGGSAGSTRSPKAFTHQRETQMAIRTVDMDMLANLTGNMYETVAILSKRARQVSMHTKAELDEKLAYFEGFEQELEDPRFQEEQARISLEYEVRPEASETSIGEFLEGEIYYRDASAEELGDETF